MIALVVAILGLAVFFLLESSVSDTTDSSGIPPAPSPQIAAVAAAIAKAEGSNPEWNNPGDLTISFGYPTSGTANSAGVLIFQSAADGWNALYKQLSAIVNGNSRYNLTDTIATFGMGYSGGDPNWAINVAAALGVTTDTHLGDILA